jgi:hypothetical protein
MHEGELELQEPLRYKIIVMNNFETPLRLQKHVIYVNKGEAGVTVLILNMFSFVSQLERYSQFSDSVTVFKK